MISVPPPPQDVGLSPTEEPWGAGEYLDYTPSPDQDPDGAYWEEETGLVATSSAPSQSWAEVTTLGLGHGGWDPPTALVASRAQPSCLAPHSPPRSYTSYGISLP